MSGKLWKTLESEVFKIWVRRMPIALEWFKRKENVSVRKSNADKLQTEYLFNM
jgi:hypothetical protein